MGIPPRIMSMNLQDRQILAELKARIAAALPERLRSIIVFGSRARGDAAPDADLDVIALVDRREPGIERQLDDIAYAVMWDHDFCPIISLKVFSEAQFASYTQKGFSFYRHVTAEGIAV